jgi:FkbM family methyltransferase
MAMLHYPTWRLRQRQQFYAIDTLQGRFIIRGADRGIGWQLYAFRQYELDHVQDAVSWLLAAGFRLDGRILIDVGANIGSASVPLMRLGGFSKLVAIEPDATNCRLLGANLWMNKLHGITNVVNKAVSDANTVVNLELSESMDGDHRVRIRIGDGVAARFDEGKRNVVRVPAVRLDHVVQETKCDPAQVGLVWMDVQGHESNVFAGGSELFGFSPPLMIELWPYGLARAGSSINALVAALETRWPRFVSWHARVPRVRPIQELLGYAKESEGTTFSNVLLVSASPLTGDHAA